MNRKLLASLTTLTLIGCGSTGSPTVTQSSELSPAESVNVINQAKNILRGQQAAGEELIARAVIQDDTGATHVRFDKRFQGLRVLGGDFVAHQDEVGQLSALSTHNEASLAGLSIKPLINAAGASVLAERAFTGAGGAPTLQHIVLNALTGAVLETSDEVQTAAATGTGNSLYVGATSIGINSISGGYEMRDVSRGSGFYTKSSTTGSVFTSTSTTFGNGSSSNTASAAVDAHYGIQKTYDYYKNVHGRNGIDGAGKVGYNTVHYGSSYNNAYWSDSCFCMTYGDGDGSTFTPLTALDVAGHEMTHGVTSRTAGLVYSGESGGLNEATSDIFGSMVEFYSANASDPGDYLIGEKIYTPGTAGDALRYMYNPSKDGRSANCWSSTVGNLDVHNSSGVANHFYYLLAEGSNGSPASPTCNGATVTGIGRSAAEKIWYRALTVYMTSGTKFAAARTATLSAAKDLYGSGSTQYNAVASAWAAVSVN